MVGLHSAASPCVDMWIYRAFTLFGLNMIGPRTAIQSGPHTLPCAIALTTVAVVPIPSYFRPMVAVTAYSTLAGVT